jgi:hypothetical protein
MYLVFHISNKFCLQRTICAIRYGRYTKSEKYIRRATSGVDPSTKLNRNPPRPRRNTANSGLMNAHRHTATPTMRAVFPNRVLQETRKGSTRDRGKHTYKF